MLKTMLNITRLLPQLVRIVHATVLVTAALWAFETTAAPPQDKIVRNSKLQVGVWGSGDLSFDVNGVRADWENPLPGNTPLYDFTGECSDDATPRNFITTPLITEEGHHITLAEWHAAKGVAHARCVPGGTEFRVSLKRLVPNGLYTLWMNTYTGSGYHVTETGEWDFSNFIGGGALGLPDGSPVETYPNYTANAFRASWNGDAEITIVQPAGAFSMMGSMPECLFGEVPGDAPNQTIDISQVAVVLAYHMDGQPHGGVPHDDAHRCDTAFQGAFFFTR